MSHTIRILLPRQVKFMFLQVPENPEQSSAAGLGRQALVPVGRARRRRGASDEMCGPTRRGNLAMESDPGGREPDGGQSMTAHVGMVHRQWRTRSNEVSMVQIDLRGGEAIGSHLGTA